MNARAFTALSVAVLVGFLVLTGFNALQEGQRKRDFIRDYELPALGMAVEASLDRTAAAYHRVGEDLLRYGFLRDWILGGEQDEDELRAFLENVRSRFDMMDASIVSDRSETYYGTDGRTLALSPENRERDGWYYLYRDSLMTTNIDAWYYPETGQIGMWVNVPILDDDGTFLGITGGGIDAEEFSETLHAYGQLPGVNVYLARTDGQLVYATDKNLLAAPMNKNQLWDHSLTEGLEGTANGPEYRVLQPSGMLGPILWTSFSEGWNTYLVLEKTGESVAGRVQETMRSSLLAGGLLAVTLYGISLSIILAARKKIEEQTRRLEDLASKDPLTGLHNRIYFSRIMEREVARIGRTGEESCLLLLDIDNFKRINDSFGHPCGDAVLSTIASVVRSQLRNTDDVARFGGEEFAILLPGTTLDGAHSVADKIRSAIQCCCFDGLPPSLCVTASIGIAALNGDQGLSLELAYQEADRALYRAKELGRNRIELAV